MLSNFLGAISVWTLQAACVDPREQHRGDLPPESREDFGIAKHPSPTSSLPAELCYPAACPKPGHQKYIHTSLHLSKFSRNQARHATSCSSALACPSRSPPWCDGAGPLPPAKHTALGWQRLSRLPALQVNVFQHWLCRPLAALLHFRTDNYKEPGYCWMA